MIHVRGHLRGQLGLRRRRNSRRYSGLKGSSCRRNGAGGGRRDDTTPDVWLDTVAPSVVGECRRRRSRRWWLLLSLLRGKRKLLAVIGKHGELVLASSISAPESVTSSVAAGGVGHASDGGTATSKARAAVARCSGERIPERKSVEDVGDFVIVESASVDSVVGSERACRQGRVED